MNLETPKWWCNDINVISWLPEYYNLCNNYNKHLKSVTSKSWFTARNLHIKTTSNNQQNLTNYKQIYSVKKNLKENEPNSLTKIQIYPTTTQKSKLRELFGANRYVYNQVVGASALDQFTLKNSDFKKKYRYLSIKKSMDAPDYITDKPEECFDSAFRDVEKAIKTTKALSKALKNKNGSGFKYNPLKFKTKKQNSNSIEIRSRGFTIIQNSIRFWPSYFEFKKNEGFKVKGTIPEINYSCRLQQTKNCKYFLCIPTYKEFKHTSSNKVCSLDPGVRSLITGYDPNGKTFEFGSNINKMLTKAFAIDKLRRKIKKFKGKRNQRYRLKKKWRYLETKIKNCILDCHHKITKYLSENYNKVLLPEFNTQEMLRKKTRNISKKTARSMNIWSHYKFKMMLEYKMNRTGGKLIMCTEEYTSKTCSNCGKINHNLKKSKVFNCEHCKLTIDRDVNGARNIYLKNHKLLSL